MTRTLDDFDGRADEIEQTAAEWVARIDLHGTPEEWTALDTWLNGSARHRAAFLRLSVAWRQADVLKKLQPLSGAVDADLLDPARWSTDTAADEPRPLRVVASSENPASTDRDWAAARVYRAKPGSPANHDGKISAQSTSATRRFSSIVTSRRVASVAVLAVAALGGLGAWYGISQSQVDTYSTRVGEFHRVTLGDGSIIALNTNSKVKVRYTSNTRHVDLVYGEALFEVAKNPARPFDVESGGTTVRAVGTAFSVRLHEEDQSKRVDVVVSEGRVAINPPSKATYPAGTVAIVRNGRVETSSVDSNDIMSRLAWITGRLMFQGEKLSDVVAEINRYNQRQLQITDPDIAELHIGGTFQSTDPDGFARALGSTFGIRSHLVSQPFGNDVIRLDSGVP
ncbi:MAG: FecR domain-containing protein [Gammaproteobacteria bacterium]